MFFTKETDVYMCVCIHAQYGDGIKGKKVDS